ncbi:MAG: polysaccharide deacetylase family protein, partial [Thermoproteota archaeon]|nr:polysaccharide deacetylase family protein [Thermoproteota archaeon]
TIMVLFIINTLSNSHIPIYYYSSLYQRAFSQLSSSTSSNVARNNNNNNHNNNNNNNNNKAVILNFDDSLKGQYTNAKPILDKYGFKATFYVVCNDVGKKQNFMNWTEVKALKDDGQDIGSHTMNHAHLTKISEQDMEFEVGQSKQCLADHVIDAKSFAYPYAEGSDDKTIVDTVAKYYEFGRTGNSPLMFLHCDRLKNDVGDDKELFSSQTDCRTYTDDG